MPTPEPTRVVLVGFMAAGKSTVGRILADRLGWDFVDFDEEIERRTGMTVPDIFLRRGERYFRDREAALTAELAHREGVVLAPGGGWITQPELLESLGPDSLVVWLRLTPEEAVRRALGDAVKRPLLAGPDPLGRAEFLMAEREPLYRLADVAVDVVGKPPDEVAWEIAQMVRGH
ncbi:MAG: shikimate kinase [Gemmatimonadetes bacterium]|nr:shikimate kinase [Gemmatimonadota bacterium]